MNLEQSFPYLYCS